MTRIFYLHLIDPWAAVAIYTHTHTHTHTHTNTLSYIYLTCACAPRHNNSSNSTVEPLIKDNGFWIRAVDTNCNENFCLDKEAGKEQCFCPQNLLDVKVTGTSPLLILMDLHFPYVSINYCNTFLNSRGQRGKNSRGGWLALVAEL